MTNANLLNLAHSLGKQIARTTVVVNGVTYQKDQVVSISIDANGSIGKTLMQEAVVEIQNMGDGAFARSLKDKSMTIEIEINVGSVYQSRNFGTFIIRDAEYSDEYQSITITAYDLMIKTMKQASELQTSNVTVRDALIQIAGLCGLSYNSTSIPSTFTNSSQYIGTQASANQYTYRDMLDDIAEVTGSIIMIRNGLLTVRYPTSVSATIDASNYSRMEIDGSYRINRVSFAQRYTDILSDCDYKEQSGATEYTEVRYVNNIFFEGNGSQTWVDNLYSRLYTTMGSFCPFDCTSFGELALEIGDKITVKDRANTSHTSIVTSDHITITDGIAETIGGSMPFDYLTAAKTSSETVHVENIDVSGIITAGAALIKQIGTNRIVVYDDNNEVIFDANANAKSVNIAGWTCEKVNLRYNNETDCYITFGKDGLEMWHGNSHFFVLFKGNDYVHPHAQNSNTLIIDYWNEYTEEGFSYGLGAPPE